MSRDPYAPFRGLDGSHPLRDAAPRASETYPARRLRDAEVVFFNYGLAREMGLIPASHADRLTRELREAILEAFAIRIVNEWDVANKVEIPLEDWKPGRYMATRYLQLQHPGRTGKTSGDGRSVWIGTVAGPTGTWDVTACGTGVTRLCPATAETGKFYKTGSRTASYGCGTASVEEGLAAALMSEHLHREGIATERVLAVLDTGDGFAVNVRAGRNLLRPAHFLVWSKQRDVGTLRAIGDYYCDRQEANGDFARRSGAARWGLLAQQVARAFARQTAAFEIEYLFVWLDWDGDNVLMDGGILDYGSVRQFGLFHRDYRYDDDTRWSTTIPEQRLMARRIVQNFAQIRDVLATGRHPSLRSLENDAAVRLFDEEFETWRLRFLLRRVGIDSGVAEPLLGARRSLVERFFKEHRWFESVRSRRGPRKVSDGVTWNAVYATRDLLRELPSRWLATGGTLPPREILEIAASSYASRGDRRATAVRLKHAEALQQAWFDLVQAAAALTGVPATETLASIAERAAAANPYAGITGDAVVHAAARIARGRAGMSPDAVYGVVRRFVARDGAPPAARTTARKVFDAMIADAEALRHGI